MRYLSLLLLLTVSCAAQIQMLSLSDGRLPIDAKKWLADADDEVAIARARLDDAKIEYYSLQRYLNTMRRHFQNLQTEVKAKLKKEAAKTSQAVLRYSKERLAMANMIMEQARKRVELSKKRLILAHAETAIRHDIAVYEIEPIVREVARLRAEQAAITKQIEQQKVLIENKYDELWRAYSSFVKKGGVANVLWLTR